MNALVRGLAAVVALLLPAAVQAAMPVTVSVPPQAYLVERIGGDRVDVSVMIESGGSPHTFSLAPRRLVAFDEARVYFKVGHPDFAFERRFLRHLESRRDDVQVVDLSQGVDVLAMQEHGGHGDDHAGHNDGYGAGEHGHEHDHDHEQEHHAEHGDEAGHEGHAHGETDPHLWVSPAIMRAAAGRVAEALIAADPAGEAHYRDGLESVRAEIDALDEDIRDLLGGLERRRFVVNHPGWGYFARDYGLEQVAIESGGRDPSPSQLAGFIEQARREGVRVIFVQQGFSERSARTIAEEIGAVVATADPLARDWADNLRRFAEAIHEAETR